MKFLNVPVDLGSDVKLFHFFVEESASYDALFRIVCEDSKEDRILYVNEDFAPVSGNMPSDWINPIIKKLILLLKFLGQPDGVLH